MKQEIKKIALIGIVGIFACAGLFGATVNNTKDTTAKTDPAESRKDTKSANDGELIKKIEILNNTNHKIELTFIEQAPGKKDTDKQSITVEGGKKAHKETKNVEVFGKGKLITDIEYALDGEKTKRSAMTEAKSQAPDQRIVFLVTRDAAHKVLNITINNPTAALNDAGKEDVKKDSVSRSVTR